MLKLFAEPEHRQVTIAFGVAFLVTATAALVIGLDGNAVSNLLAIVSANALVLAVVHPWRRLRYFRYLLLASLVGFAGFALLHNLLEMAAASVSGLFSSFLQLLSGFAFFTALYLCPPALIIGVIGMTLLFLRDRMDGL